MPAYKPSCRSRQGRGRREGGDRQTDRRGSKGNVRVSQVREGARKPVTTLNGSANGIECSCAFLQFKFLIEITNWCQRDEAGLRMRIHADCDCECDCECGCGCEYDECESLTIYKYVYEKKIAKNKNKARKLRMGQESYDEWVKLKILYIIPFMNPYIIL